MSSNPYDVHVEKIQDVMKGLMVRMLAPDVDSALFRNIAAVYIVWQNDLHDAQKAQSDWEKAHG